MKERPILFSAPMVRALLAGTKTQTRRVAKLDTDGLPKWGCPYGQPYDRLWVRETWLSLEENGFAVDPDVVYYRADGEQVSAKIEGESYNLSKVWRPSIFMPRWASRITLEVVTVRVERLQDISEEDAKAEGVNRTPEGHYTSNGGTHYFHYQHHMTAKGAYHTLWASINGPDSWGANPWVWVVEFKRI